MDYASKITNLRQRASEIDARVAELVDKRREHALGAVDGSKVSVKAISDIDVECDGLRRVREKLTAAIEQTERLKTEQEAEISRKDRQARELEAQKLADAVLVVSGRIDGKLLELRELFEERAGLIRQLSAVNIVPTNLIQRLLSRFGANAALRFAKIHEFAGVDYVEPIHIRSLAESGAFLRGRLTATTTIRAADMDDKPREFEQPAA